MGRLERWRDIRVRRDTGEGASKAWRVMTVDWWGDLAVESCAGIREAAMSELV